MSIYNMLFTHLLEEQAPPPPQKRNIEWTQQEKDLYQFGGTRYSMRGTAKYGPDQMIDQKSGNYTYPNGETQDEIYGD